MRKYAASQSHNLDEDEGLTETQKAMRKMKANISVINGSKQESMTSKRESPLKTRRLSMGASSRGVGTP